MLCLCYLHTQIKLLVTAIFMWWHIHVHIMTSQGRNLGTETFTVSSILRTSWEPTVAAAVFMKWHPGRIFKDFRGNNINWSSWHKWHFVFLWEQCWCFLSLYPHLLGIGYDCTPSGKDLWYIKAFWHCASVSYKVLGFF